MIATKNQAETNCDVFWKAVWKGVIRMTLAAAIFFHAPFGSDDIVDSSVNQAAFESPSVARLFKVSLEQSERDTHPLTPSHRICGESKGMSDSIETSPSRRSLRLLFFPGFVNAVQDRPATARHPRSLHPTHLASPGIRKSSGIYVESIWNGF